MLAGVDPAGSDPTQGCVIWRMQSRQQGVKVIHVKDAGLRGCPSEFGGAAAVIDERSEGFCG